MLPTPGSVGRGRCVLACATTLLLGLGAGAASAEDASSPQGASTPAAQAAPSAVPQPGAAAQAAPAQAQPAGAPAKPPERHVDIDAYDVDGNTKLDQETIESAVYPYLGPGRTREDVESARNALEHAYQERGYQSVVVEIPPQTVSAGIVKLHVVEAPIGRLRVVGSRYYLPSTIKEQVPALAEGQVPNLKEAQAELNDVNRLPDRRVTPTLKAGTTPGTIDVDLHVNDTLPLHGSAELNNDHSPNTDPLRALATVHYDNLWQMGHSASFTFLRAPQNVHSGQVFSGSYLAPVWGSPWSVLTYGYTSNSDVNTLGGTNVLGNGHTIGTRGILQLPSFGDFAETLNFGIDYKHFLEGVTLGTSGTTAIVDYWPLSGTYNLQWQTPETEVGSSLTAVFGTRGIGTSPFGIENNRAFARANFVHLNADVTLTQHLIADTEAVVHFAGQLADGPLLSSEQFAAGGLTSVRGYLQSEAIGDDGLLEANELRSPSLVPLLPDWAGGGILDDWRFFGFGDLARVWIIGALPGQTGAFTLESAGGGVRISALGHFTGLLDVGVPLRAGPTTQAGKPNLSFSVKTEF